jgi:hypothetical protein
LIEKIKKNNIIKQIRFIYCSKTQSKRDENVGNFKKILNNEEKLMGYFEFYISDEMQKN